MARPDTSKIKALLESARQVVILLPQNPHYDIVAAGLALRLALDASGKSLTICCADPMTVEFNRLVGVDTVTTTFGSGNFIIAFADQTESVDKVSYNLERGELQLVITPKNGAPAIDHRKLKFVPSSISADLVILVGVENLFDLGPLYHDSRQLLTQTQVISVTKNIPLENFSPHSLHDPDSSSISELMAHMIDTIGLNLHSDVATNLLAGLEKATDFFRSPSVTHSTFEIAAHLVRKGARRHSDALSASQFPSGSIPSQPYTSPATPVAASPSTSGWGTDSQNLVTDTAAASPKPKDPPSDWYEPKIYRGPMLP
jgi:hypothetical protein